MIYDLVEVIPKRNKGKIFFLILIIAILALAGGAGILLAKFNSEKDFSQKEDILNKIVAEEKMKEEVPNQETAPKEEATGIENVEKRVLDENIIKPYTLTEKGKENVKNIYHSEEKIAYLTFDDGPSKTVTPLILDLLKQENIKATFFLLGSRVEYYPELVKREYEEGHYIANHGYSHLYSSIYSNPEAVLAEYNQTENAIRKALNDPEFSSHLFRFPGGSHGGKYIEVKKQAIELLEQNDICYVDWNSLSQDSAGAKTKEKLIENTINTVGEKKVVVILMHDAGDKILTYESLPDVICYLREKGYTFKNFYDVIE